MGFKLFWRIGSVTVLNALVFAGHWAGPVLAQVKPPESEILPFIGTWTAVHAGTPIIVLHLRSEKGQLVGGVQVCSYSVNTETTGTVDVVTDPTLSKSLPINNIKVSGRSMSFDWKDPDGDYDHWRLELTGKNEGQIVWVGLPSDARVQPIPVSKSIPKSRYVVYYRPIFLISFLQEVFLRSVILFQSDFCFVRKDLRFRLDLLSSGGAERSIKRIAAL